MPMARSERALRAVAAALLAFAPALALAADADLAQAILAHLSKPGSAQVPFVEASYNSMLDRPLITSGTMQWLGGDRLERDIDKPYKMVAKIGDGQMSLQRGNHPVQSMPMSRAPQVAAILSGFRALLGGDAAQVARDFDVRATGDEARWVLTLAPRADELKHRVRSIVIDGRNDAPRCMTMTGDDGDTTITLLGATAQAGLPSSMPQQSAVAAFCRNG